ncbi:heme-binding protein [Streptomyces sp. AK02-01A]|uniref:GlcG/HbpS family heme-binding protein n=1 Tax=Streptomyces sp. AK02-01A TaxID=3028648 RepID=UPI0029AD9C9C|nr:heme-binding protein [Streptomyces sp. AK02-01A]MDX3853726.1 heme-binding protein [Streptomyces sp. AK02-01A]
MISFETVSLADARKVIDAGEKRAQEIAQPCNIAVVDHGGNLVAHIRMDEAWIGSIDVAISKAFTARALNVSTRELAVNAATGGPVFGINTSNQGRIVIFPGGIPLLRNGKVVGAVGVSGGTVEEDQSVAEAAVAAFEADAGS